MAGLAELASKLGQATQPIKSAAYLITLDPQTDSPTFSTTLQYFPDTISDSKSVSWQAKEVPGGSLPMYQWSGSGERTLSFTAAFTCDIDLHAKAATPDGTVKYTDLKTRIQDNGQLKYNVDIRSAVVWLRSHMLPTYDKEGRAIAPPKLILYMPNSGIGAAGGFASNFASQPDAVLCVMASCEVSYESFFPSGLPRTATVSLSFNQIPQYKGQIVFPQMDAASLLEPLRGKDGSANGGGYMGYVTKYWNTVNSEPFTAKFK